MAWLQGLFGKRNTSLDPLVDKLRLIVLSSAPLFEIPAEINATLDIWRQLTRGTISEEEAEVAIQRLGAPDLAAMKILWEPLSDSVGELIAPQGWNVTATMYLLNGQPWWLVRADHARPSGPTRADDELLSSIVDRLGADPKRDLIMDMNFPEARWARYYTWFHSGPLYETHLNKTTVDLRVVPAGTQPAPGYERLPRIGAEL
jgi:hypothetical protein